MAKSAHQTPEHRPEHSDNLFLSQDYILVFFFFFFCFFGHEWDSWARAGSGPVCHIVFVVLLHFSFLFVISATTADFLSLASAAGVQPHKYSCRNISVSASTVWAHLVRGRCVEGRPSFSSLSLLLFCVLCKSRVVADQTDITYLYFIFHHGVLSLIIPS